MKTYLTHLTRLTFFTLATTTAFAQGTAFTYQGRLTDNGTNYTGNAEFQATLWSVPNGGTALASNSPFTITVAVTNGLFVLPLDFGANFPGAQRWLQLELRTAPGTFTRLSPRQQITPTPYAIQSASAASAASVSGPVSAAQLTGTIPSNNIGAGSITTVMLAAGSVGSNQLAAGSVTTSALANEVFTAQTGIVSNWFALPIINPAPAASDNFGHSVAAAGSDRILIGAYFDDTDAVNAGAAYLFTTDGALVTTFANPTPDIDDQFGSSVAALGSGRVIIGAPYDDTGATDAGAAYLFTTDGTRLVTFSNPTPAVADLFGYAVAAVGSDRVLVGAFLDDTGAENGGAAYLFSTDGTLLTTLTNSASNASFGISVAAMGSDRMLIGAAFDDTGATDAGAAYLFHTNGTLLTTFTNPAPATGDRFGISIAAVGNDRVLIGADADDTGAFNAGAAYLFSTNGTWLTTFTNPTPAVSDVFGFSLAAVGSDRVLIGAHRDDTSAADVGAAYLFSTDGMLLTTFSNPRSGFVVRNIRANVGVCDLDTADSVLANPAQQTSVFTEYAPVINYINLYGGSRFGDDFPFPGFIGNVDENNFVLEAIGLVSIPTSGNWTFGVTSDDGFRCNIGTNVFSHPSPRTAGDTLATFNLAAGEYPVRLVFYECQGAAEVEFYAASGTHFTFSASAFRLVGDTAAGGLAVKASESFFGSSVAAVGNDRVLIGAPRHSAYDSGAVYLFTLETYAKLIADGVRARSITTASLADGAVTAAKLDRTIGVWTRSGDNVYRQAGNVGIGTSTPAFTLEVNGTAGKPGGGSWSVASDQRLKKNIRPLTGALDKLLALHAVNFEYIDPARIHELSGERMGLLAQEVEKVFPDWVETGPDGYKRVTVRGLEALLVEALRELQQKHETKLAEESRRRDAENAELKQRLERLETLLNHKLDAGAK